ncbi:hypothetical protein [Bradyrhizobium zhanjiangense]|uniref:hypothetical protein n=1 Tax=Bradyrhizobium zhanjiangense TaxID=1325107 RepID=UPI0013E8AD90|nr:hypothetical protein [Bradyrhizobium zhanjiangense]
MFEEIGVLDAIENLDEPRQRMRLELGEPALLRLEEAEDRGNPELGQSPVGDLGVDMLRQHALDLAKAEGKLDEALLQLHHGLGDVDNVVADGAAPRSRVRNSPHDARD